MSIDPVQAMGWAAVAVYCIAAPTWAYLHRRGVRWSGVLPRYHTTRHDGIARDLSRTGAVR